jgi:hypothetical protein
MGTNMEREQTMQQILEILAKMEENINAGQEQMMADRISDREYMKKMMVRTDDNQEKMDTNLKEMREEIKSGQAEMRSILDSRLRVLKNGRKETTACQEATITEPNPGMMQSIEEHQEFPKVEAAVMPIGGPRKRRRVRYLAAERSQKWKERLGDPGGSWLPPAGRCPAVQKWHGEREIFSGKFGPRETVDRERNWPSRAER